MSYFPFTTGEMVPDIDLASAMERMTNWSVIFTHVSDVSLWSELNGFNHSILMIMQVIHSVH